MATIRYELARDIPLSREADVIVVGGGPGGLGAAVMAARAGAKTLLVERYGCLGGMASVGEVQPFMANHANGICLDKPVYVEWVKRMKDYLPDNHPMRQLNSAEIDGRSDRVIAKDLAMLAAEDLCLEAGVEILYHHALADAIVSDGKIEALVLLSKSGYTAVRAPIFIDCTGDADLAARAGCTTEHGGPSGHCQPMTLCFKLSHIDRERVPERAEINKLYDQAKADGELDCPRENVLFFASTEDSVVHFNTTRVIHLSGADGLELSQAEIEGRRQLRQYLTFFRRHVPGFENAEIHSLAHHIGVRESRRVRGLEYIGRDAFTDCAKFPDAIARVRYPIDICIGTGFLGISEC